MKTIVILLLVSGLLYAQSEAGHQVEPTVEIVTPQPLDSSTTTDSLRHLDFRNRQLNVFDERGKVILSTKLRNGKFESKWTTQKGSDWLRLDWVRFVGDKSEFAVVSLSWVTTGASASDYGIVQVYTLRDGHPVVVQQMRYNTRGCGTSSEFSNSPVMLTIKGVHGWEHCCPKTLDIVTFGWADGSFHRKAHRTAPLSDKC